MATSLDLARELVAAAERDLVILTKGVPDAEIPIEVLGFHCHQAVEKCIKAVLAVRQVEYRKIHDITTLLDLVRDAGVEAPSAKRLGARPHPAGGVGVNSGRPQSGEAEK